ncbi:hypothetical protein BDV38DRAFT_216564 [Aspergillus pseudotamarii]|uniref:Uncharacterized protein n=1 Tax=Aspergillus pseudotamarii TaxID=132259 RepID=A0A5N6SCB2_ASPPS|nr:uncharacterized protein BDV38DRAFT_216564 [Aspergillus pseudotamarii]KAE8132225.1 hypothetical protein BDV38DRAFT_216564 [Aspergillus pseudotamarii]
MSCLCLPCLLAEGLSLSYVFTLMQRRVMTLSFFSFLFSFVFLFAFTNYIFCISIILPIQHAELTTVFHLLFLGSWLADKLTLLTY